MQSPDSFLLVAHTLKVDLSFFCKKGQDENVEANLRQYGLEHRYVDMLVADAASSIWRQQEIFDAIVTDRKLPLSLLALRARDDI